MQSSLKKFIYPFVFLLSAVFHFYWLNELQIGIVPGPVDPFLKTLQGYSLYMSKFTDQSLIYAFRDIDPTYEFCLFQKDIFTFRFGNSLLGPFPIALTSLVAILFNLFTLETVYIFFATLNLVLYWVIFKNVKPFLSISILVFFGLPFFIPNSEVSEHSLLIFTQITGFIFFRKAIYQFRRSETRKNKLLLISGLVFGFGIFLRHELILYGNILLGFLLISMILRRKNVKIKYTNILIFGLGLYISFILFFIMNKFMYGSSVGPRLNVNSTGLYSDIFAKIHFYKVILWKEGPYFGLFGYNPIFLFTIGLFLFFYRKWTFYDKILFFPIIGLIILVPSLAPNDGGSPWGARFLFLCIFPLVWLSSRILHWTKSFRAGKFTNFIPIVIILSVFQTVINERKGLKAAKEVAIQQKNYIVQTRVKEADLIIFTSELVAMQTGLNYIYYPTILLNNENHIPSLEFKFLKDNRRFRNFALIEPITDGINLTNFSKEDLLGVKPESIIRFFDKKYKKLSVAKKDLIIIHYYANIEGAKE